MKLKIEIRIDIPDRDWEVFASSSQVSRILAETARDYAGSADIAIAGGQAGAILPNGEIFIQDLGDADENE